MELDGGPFLSVELLVHLIAERQALPPGQSIVVGIEIAGLMPVEQRLVRELVEINDKSLCVCI